MKFERRQHDKRDLKKTDLLNKNSHVKHLGEKPDPLEKYLSQKQSEKTAS